jgi:hypothetical protein
MRITVRSHRVVPPAGNGDPSIGPGMCFRSALTVPSSESYCYLDNRGFDSSPSFGRVAASALEGNTEQGASFRSPASSRSSVRHTEPTGSSLNIFSCISSDLSF